MGWAVAGRSNLPDLCLRLCVVVQRFERSGSARVGCLGDGAVPDGEDADDALVIVEVLDIR